MPADQPGRTQAGRKAPRRAPVKRGRPIPRAQRHPQKRVVYHPITTPRKGSPGTGQPGARHAPPLKTPRFRPDDKSDAERLRVEKFKATPLYRKTLRDVYSTKSVTRRRAQRRYTTQATGDYGLGRTESVARPRPVLEIRKTRPAAEKKALLSSTTMESAILQTLHRQRIARNRELTRARAQHDIPTNEDFKRAALFKDTRQWREAMQAARGARRYGKSKPLAPLIAAESGEAARIRTSGLAAEFGASEEAARLDPRRTAFQRRIQSTALEAIENVSRPLLAIEGGAYAGLKGRNVLTGAGRGFALKEKHYGGDVLDAAGIHNKVARSILGFGLDVVADPLTYLSLGTYAPAKEAAELAFRKTLREASEEAARRGLQHGTQEAREFEWAARGDALHAAQQAHDEHALAGARGFTIGARGKVPFTNSERLRFNVRLKPLGEGTARLHKFGQSVRRFTGKGGGRRMRIQPGSDVDQWLSEAWHTHRPRGVDEFAWEEFRRIATSARGGISQGERAAKLIAKDIGDAVRKAHLTDDDQVMIAKAIDEGPEAVAALPETHRPVADRIVEVLERAGREEQERGLLGPLIGERVRPDVPERTIDIDTLRKDAAAADRKVEQAQAKVLKAERASAEAQGRAQILSRNVGGRHAEEKVRKLLGPKGEPLFEAGGHGVEQTFKGVREADAELAAAKAEAAAARKAVREALPASSAERKAIREAERAQQRFDESAGGYFPRIRRQDVDEVPAGVVRRRPISSRGRIVDDPSLHQRTDWRPLTGMDADDALQRYVLEDLAYVVGQRMGAHARMIALSDAQRRMQLLIGTPIRKIEDIHSLGGIEGYSVMRRDRKGHHDLLGEDSTNLDKVQRALDEGKELYLMPKRDIDLVYDLMGRGRSAKASGDSKFAQAFDYVQGLVKTTQTVINPGYHVTNLLGDLYNAQIAGTSGVSVFRAGQLLRQAMREDRRMRHAVGKDFDDMDPKARGKVEDYPGLGRKASDAEVVMLAQRHGAIQMGHGAAELVQLANAGEDLATFGEAFSHYRRGNLVKGFRADHKATMDLVRRFNERREDLVRMATFHSALKRGMDPEDAAAWVNRHHFDYGDLTDVERRVARRFIPFYIFYARNSRLQLEALGRAPGVLSHVASLKAEAEEWTPLPEGWTQMLKEYQQRGVPIAIPDVAGIAGGQPLMVYPKLPLTDLNQLPSPSHPMDWPGAMGRDLLGRASMFVKVPLELTTGLNLFFRDKDKKHVPAPGWARFLPKDVQNLIGVKEGYSKKRQHSLYWSSWFDKFMRVAPATNLGANLGAPQDERHPGGRALPLISYFSGPKVNTLGGTGTKQRTILGEVGIANLYDRYNEIQDQLEDPVNKAGPNDKKERPKLYFRRKALKSEASKLLQEVWRLDRDMGVPKAQRRGVQPKGSGKGHRPRASGSSAVYGPSAKAVYGTYSRGVYNP